MAENGHYWQIEGESATAENIDIVLSDLSDIVEQNTAEEHYDVVKFFPGTGGEKGHFGLGEGGQQIPPINAIAGEVLIGDGHDWATGNAVDLKLMKRIVSNASIGSFGTFSAQFETDQVNCFSFFSMKSDVEPTIFVIDKGSKLAMGKTGVHDYVPGVWQAPMFWDDEVKAPKIYMDGGAQIIMDVGDDTQVPTIQMLGNSLLKFAYSKNSTFFPRYGANPAETVRRYADPYGLVKNNSYYDQGAPIMTMLDDTTFQMLDNAFFQAKNGSQTVIQGNANVHISGGAWSDNYHATVTGHLIIWAKYKINGSWDSTERTLTFTLTNAHLTPLLTKFLLEDGMANEQDFKLLVNECDGKDGITIAYANTNKEDFLTYEFWNEGIAPGTDSSGGRYIDTANSQIHDINQSTFIGIGPNSKIKIGGNEDANADITISPAQVFVGVGSASGYYAVRPSVSSVYGDNTPTTVRSYDFSIDKTFISNGNINLSSLVTAYQNNVSYPSILLDTNSGIHYSGNAFVEITTPSSSVYHEAVNVAGSSIFEVIDNIGIVRDGQPDIPVKGRVTKTFSGDYVEIITFNDNTSIDIEFNGQTAISITPETMSDKANQKLGIDFGIDKFDAVGHIEKFQAIMSAHDSFIQWDGDTHFESWSGTQIFRPSNPNLIKQRKDQSDNPEKYYPYFFDNETGTVTVSKTITVSKDVSNYTSQQIIDEFGSQLLADKPADTSVRTYSNGSIDVNSVTKTFVNSTYEQHMPAKTPSSGECWLDGAFAYVYSDIDAPSLAAVLNDANTQYSELKTLAGRAINISGTWNLIGTFNQRWEKLARDPSNPLRNFPKAYRYKIGGNIHAHDGVYIIYRSNGTATPSNFRLPSNTVYGSLNTTQRGYVDTATTYSDGANKIYDSDGLLIAWSGGGTMHSTGSNSASRSKFTTGNNTNYHVEVVGSSYSITAETVFPYVESKQHLGKNWLGPIQTADRVGQNPADWEKGPITQMYGPTNFLMREKWEADADHTKSYQFTTTETYDTTNQAKAIDDFINSQDYTGFQNELTTNNYTLWDILSISGSSGSYTISYSICDAGWKPHLDSYPDNPVVEITDDSELRLYGGAKIKAETKYGETTITFSGTQTEGEVSFTLDELRMLKTLVGSVRTAVVNDASQATEPGTLYFIDEGGNA